MFVLSDETTSLGAAELAKHFRDTTPPNWTATAFANIKGDAADSVAFVRSAGKGFIAVSIRMHLPSGRCDVLLPKEAGYLYKFLTSAQRAIWEWLGYMGRPRATSHDIQAVVWQRLDGVSYFSPPPPAYQTLVSTIDLASEALRRENSSARDLL